MNFKRSEPPLLPNPPEKWADELVSLIRLSRSDSHDVVNCVSRTSAAINNMLQILVNSSCGVYLMRCVAEGVGHVFFSVPAYQQGLQEEVRWPPVLQGAAGGYAESFIAKKGHDSNFLHPSVPQPWCPTA